MNSRINMTYKESLLFCGAGMLTGVVLCTMLLGPSLECTVTNLILWPFVSYGVKRFWDLVDG